MNRKLPITLKTYSAAPMMYLINSLVDQLYEPNSSYGVMNHIVRGLGKLVNRSGLSDSIDRQCISAGFY